MKKFISLVITLLLCFSCITGVSASATEVADLNTTEINSLYSVLNAEGIVGTNIELISNNTYAGDSISYSDSASIGTRIHEKVYRYIDVEKSRNSQTRSPVYSYINDYTVEIYLYNKETYEEWARGYVSANFRYNSDYQEAKCLSTDAGEISALEGYTVETSHRTNNSTWDVGGAYGEVNFKWGLLGIFKNRNIVTITCDSNGNVDHTHTKLDS